MAKSKKFEQQVAAVREDGGETFQFAVQEFKDGDEENPTDYRVYVRCGMWKGRPWAKVVARNMEKATTRHEGGWARGFGNNPAQEYSFSNADALATFRQAVAFAERNGIFDAIAQHLKAGNGKSKRKAKKSKGNKAARQADLV